MTIEYKPYVGDKNVPLVIDFQEDISGATEKKMYIDKPGAGAIVEVPDTDITIEGTDFFKYIIPEIDIGGVWRINAWAKIGEYEGRSATVEFIAYEHFK